MYHSGVNFPDKGVTGGILKITKLHLILFVAALTGFFAFREYAARVEIKRSREELERARREDKIRAEIEEKRREIETDYLNKKTALAREAVAVAGEYLKIARRENRAASKGQATLRIAKETLEQGDPHAAWELAHRAVQEIKEAAFADPLYTVKSGDTLWNIAAMKNHFSDGGKWRHIYLANKNKIKNPRVIFRGQKFIVPVSSWGDYDKDALKVK